MFIVKIAKDSDTEDLINALGRCGDLKTSLLQSIRSIHAFGTKNLKTLPILVGQLNELTTASEAEIKQMLAADPSLGVTLLDLLSKRSLVRGEMFKLREGVHLLRLLYEHFCCQDPAFVDQECDLHLNQRLLAIAAMLNNKTSVTGDKFSHRVNQLLTRFLNTELDNHEQIGKIALISSNRSV
jgi:hypothetical protein